MKSRVWVRLCEWLNSPLRMQSLHFFKSRYQKDARRGRFLDFLRYVRKKADKVSCISVVWTAYWGWSCSEAHFCPTICPPAPARLSTICMQPFSKNVGETSSFLFYGHVFPSFRLPPQGASVKFLVLIHAYYYGLYDRPQRNDVSPH